VDLFAAYFNFLRPHSALDKNVPTVIPELLTLDDMPAKWIKLIHLSEEYISKQPHEIYLYSARGQSCAVNTLD